MKPASKSTPYTVQRDETSTSAQKRHSTVAKDTVRVSLDPPTNLHTGGLDDIPIASPNQSRSPWTSATTPIAPPPSPAGAHAGQSRVDSPGIRSLESPSTGLTRRRHRYEPYRMPFPGKYPSLLAMAMEPERREEFENQTIDSDLTEKYRALVAEKDRLLREIVELRERLATEKRSPADKIPVVNELDVVATDLAKIELYLAAVASLLDEGH